MRLYSKERLPKSQTQRKTFLRFSPEHPQYTTHCMKEITSSEKPRVPTLIGYAVPKRETDEDRHAVCMLALFKPWGSSLASPLKHDDEGWLEAYQSFLDTASMYHKAIIHNMQLLHLSRDAK
ncbi:hypothetical protein EV121DRAFT_218452, partial [Schizophyllum commune]